MADYQSQLTEIYNKLSDIQVGFSSLASLSSVNTIQDSLQNTQNGLNGRLQNCERRIDELQLILNDILAELRSL